MKFNINWQIVSLLFFLMPPTLRAADRPALGIAIADDPAGGATVTGVYFGSPAAQTGIRTGDRIVAIDKQPVAGYADVMKSIASSTPGAKVALDVVRGGEKIAVSATVGRSEQVLQAPMVGPATPVYGSPALRPYRLRPYPTWPARPAPQAPPFF